MEPKYRLFFTADEEVNTKLLIEAMDNQVLEFGKFKWEMREGTSQPYQLIISPNGDYELYEISQQIMKLAPRLRNWDFLAALPPNAQNTQFEIFDMQMNRHQYDVSNWRVVVLEQEEGVDLIAETPNLHQFDEETQLEATEKALISLLGESLFIDKITGLEVVLELEEEDVAFAIPIKNLAFELTENA